MYVYIQSNAMESTDYDLNLRATKSAALQMQVGIALVNLSIRTSEEFNYECAHVIVMHLAVVIRHHA